MTYDYDEADEVAANMPAPGRIATLDEAVSIVKEQMPDESVTVQSNVAYALLLKSRHLK